MAHFVIMCQDKINRARHQKVRTPSSSLKANLKARDEIIRRREAEVLAAGRAGTALWSTTLLFCGVKQTASATKGLPIFLVEDEIKDG